MTFRARDDYFTVYEETWFSTGAGQVRKHGEPLTPSLPLRTVSPFEFSHAAQLLALCRRNGLSVAALMMKMSCAATRHRRCRIIWRKYGT